MPTATASVKAESLYTPPPEDPLLQITATPTTSDESLGVFGTPGAATLLNLPDQTGDYTSKKLHTKELGLLVQSSCKGSGDLAIAFSDGMTLTAKCTAANVSSQVTGIDAPKGGPFTVHVTAPRNMRWTLQIEPLIVDPTSRPK